MLLSNLSALRAFLGPRARRPAVLTKACAGADNGCEKEDATRLAGLDAWLESDLMQMSLEAVGDYMVEGRNDEYCDDDKDEDEDDSDDDALAARLHELEEATFVQQALAEESFLGPGEALEYSVSVKSLVAGDDGSTAVTAAVDTVASTVVAGAGVDRVASGLSASTAAALRDFILSDLLALASDPVTGSLWMSRATRPAAGPPRTSALQGPDTNDDRRLRWH